MADSKPSITLQRFTNNYLFRHIGNTCAGNDTGLPCAESIANRLIKSYMKFDENVSVEQIVDAVEGSWVLKGNSGASLDSYDGHIVLSEDKSPDDILRECNERVCC
jgi:hypothetical protein